MVTINCTVFLVLFVTHLYQGTLQNPVNTPNKSVLVETPMIRMFSSLKEYQHTNISFNPQHVDYRGNVVAFEMRKLEKISKNSFISFGSASIVELRLENMQINTIEEGGFYGLDSLDELNLSHNNLTDMPADVFDGLENLRHLILNNNFLDSTPGSGMAFTHVRHLRYLDLSRNRIRTLHRSAFGSLRSLEELNLSYNSIRFIQAAVFDRLVHMERLILNNNYLTTVSPEKWRDLSSLRVLNLAENYITTFDASYNFSFANLKTLNLSGNCLTSLDGTELKEAFKELTALDIGNNLWLCRNLNAFKSSLVGSKLQLSPGIKCEITKPIDWAVPTPPREDPPLTTSTLELLEFVQKNVSVQIHQEIGESNRLIIDKLEYVQNFLTCICVIVIMCSLVLVFVKLQVCQAVSNAIRYQQSMYRDAISQSPESYRLIVR